jgi:quinol monooxygenase YgiN
MSTVEKTTSQSPISYTMVTYTVKPGREQDNAALGRAVFEELAQTRPAGFRYAVFQLPDSRQFVHLYTNEGAAAGALQQLPAFQAFVAAAQDRHEQPATFTEPELIGDYRNGQLAPIPRELVVQNRQDVHAAHPRVRLRSAHNDRAPHQVEVAPPQRESLSEPQPGEDQRREQGPALSAGCSRLLVEIAGAVKERHDVIGPVEPRALRRRSAQPSPLPMRRVPLDQVVVDCDLEDGRQRRDGFVDRRGGESPVLDLCHAISVNVLD